jgi:hypothetical protein
MSVKRETLITARNKVLKTAGVPQKAVAATMTNTQAGRIAWAEDRAQDPFFYDRGQNRPGYNPEDRFSVRLGFYLDGKFQMHTARTKSFPTLALAKIYMMRLI